MTIKPIKTERDYQKALKEIEKLWDAKPNTAKGDRLDVLVTLVEVYEQKHYRIDPPDPLKPSSSAWNSLSSSHRTWRIFSGAGAEYRKFSTEKGN
jgi:antitoxin component HigA of HigAB toxin-antitoxin module